MYSNDAMDNKADNIANNMPKNAAHEKNGDNALLIGGIKNDAKSPLDFIADAYWQDYIDGVPIDGGIAYETELRNCDLDGSLQSLQRIDALLEWVQASNNLRPDVYMQDDLNRNLLLFIGFYMGRVLTSAWQSPSSWIGRAQLLTDYAYLKTHPNNPFHFMALSYEADESEADESDQASDNTISHTESEVKSTFAKKSNLNTNTIAGNRKLFFVLEPIAMKVFGSKLKMPSVLGNSIANSVYEAVFKRLPLQQQAELLSQDSIKNADKTNIEQNEVVELAEQKDSGRIEQPQFEFANQDNIADGAISTDDENTRCFNPILDDEAEQHLAEKFKEVLHENVYVHQHKNADTQELIFTPDIAVEVSESTFATNQDNGIDNNIKKQSVSENLSYDVSLSESYSEVEKTNAYPSEQSLQNINKHDESEVNNINDDGFASKVNTATENTKSVDNEQLQYETSNIKYIDKQNHKVEQSAVTPIIESLREEMALVKVESKVSADVEEQYQQAQVLLNKDEHIENALALLKKSADAGHSSAMLQLALQYFTGENVEHNNVKGFTWVQLAANADDIRGQRLLSRLYYQGLGCPQSMEMGRYWLELAAENGHEEAKQVLKSWQHAEMMLLNKKQEETKDRRYIYLFVAIVIIIIFAVVLLR